MSAGLTDAERDLLGDLTNRPDYRALAEAVARIKADAIATARAEERERLAAVERLADCSVEVTEDGLVRATGDYEPYAVAVDGEVYLAVLLDDLRAALKAADQ